jgi:hypothetical protein
MFANINLTANCSEKDYKNMLKESENRILFVITLVLGFKIHAKIVRPIPSVSMLQ